MIIEFLDQFIFKEANRRCLKHIENEIPYQCWNSAAVDKWNNYAFLPKELSVFPNHIAYHTRKFVRICQLKFNEIQIVRYKSHTSGLKLKNEATQF